MKYGEMSRPTLRRSGHQKKKKTARIRHVSETPKYAGYRATDVEPDRTYQHRKAQRTTALTFYRSSRPPKGQPNAGVRPVQTALPTDSGEQVESVRNPSALSAYRRHKMPGVPLASPGARLRNKLSSHHINTSRRSERTHGSSAFFQSEQAELSRQWVMSFTVAVSSKHRKREIGRNCVLIDYDYRDATSFAGMRAAQTPCQILFCNLLILDRKMSSKVPK